MMQKMYDYLTPYEEFDKETEKRHRELSDGDKLYVKRFTELSREMISQQPMIKDESKRQWLEDVVFPYFVEMAEDSKMRVELEIDDEGLHGWIICTALVFTLNNDIWIEWEELSEIISQTSTFTISPKDNYVVAKLCFQLYKGYNKGIDGIMADQQIIKARMKQEGFKSMFESAPQEQ